MRPQMQSRKNNILLWLPPAAKYTRAGIMHKKTRTHKEAVLLGNEDPKHMKQHLLPGEKEYILPMELSFLFSLTLITYIIGKRYKDPYQSGSLPNISSIP